MALVRRAVTDGLGLSSGGDFHDPGFQRDFPGLYEFLTLSRWPDGAPRVPGTALAFAEGGRVKVCLSDKDAGLVCFVTATDWLGAWLAAEEAVGSEYGDWRAMKNPPTQRKR
jgi:hypothetical protein